MRCTGCGREVGDQAQFCEWCGTYLATPPVVGSPVVVQGHKPFPSALYLVILGVVVMLIGGVIYAIAWTETMDDMWNDPMFPDTTMDDSFFDVMMASYVVMAIGTLILFIGMILLVINE